MLSLSWIVKVSRAGASVLAFTLGRCYGDTCTTSAQLVAVAFGTNAEELLPFK